MKKKKVRVCQNLGTVAKAQRLLWKCEQDRARFKRLYVDEAMEHRKAARRLEMEIQHTAYYCDCVWSSCIWHYWKQEASTKRK